MWRHQVQALKVVTIGMCFVFCRVQALLLVNADELSFRAAWLGTRLNLTRDEMGASIAAGISNEWQHE